MGKIINVKALRMLLFVLLTLNLTVGFGQVCSTPGIDGPTASTPPINTYYPANGNITASSGTTSVSLGSVPYADPFGNSYGDMMINPGDLLLIIQIQGASFNTTGNNTYGGGDSNSGPDGLGGTGYSNLNNVGYYEYLVALNSVSLSGGVLQFRGAGSGSGLVNTYYNQDATSSQGQRRFQVVRVPQFSTLTLTSDLSCPAWNGRVGGIIALDAAGAIHMNGYTIDASGAGFRAGYQNRENSNENLSLYRTTTSDRASGKGEGIAGTPRWMFDGQNQVDQGVTWIGYPQGDYGRGAPANAGGGGNDHNAGGGGGGNGGAGGVGGNGWSGAGGAAPPHGGRPGIDLPVNLDRIFLGGGGGGGDANNALSGVKGGPGGGAIFITADLITGTGTFIANGDNGQIGVYGSAPDGAGGGGAGGSIFIKTQSSSPTANLTLIANGGNGGNTQNDDNITHLWHGPGGGGGGGTVFYSIPGATVSTQTKSGKHGITNGGAGIANGSVDGQAGSASSFSISSLPPYLQGFSASCLPQLIVNKQRLSTNPVSGGGVASYRITIENIGGGAAGGTQLRDQLPTGFSLQSASVSYSGNATGPSSLTNSGTLNQPVFEQFNIPLNGKVTIDMIVDISKSISTGTYHNGAQAHFLDPTRNSSDPTRKITAKLNAPAGTNTTYQSSGSIVTGSNYNGAPNGPTTEDVIVNAFIDAIDDNFSGSPVDGYTGGVAVVNVLQNDQFRNIQATITDVKISVVTPASHPGIVLNTLTGSVTVAPFTPGGTYTIDYKICEIGNLTNCDQAKITVSVIPTANLSITKTDNADPIVAGENITYTISISNSGPSNAINVTAVDILPAELTFVSASKTKGNFSYPNWSIDSLTVNETQTLTIVAHVNSNLLQGSSIINTVTTNSSTIDPVLTNNSASQTTAISTQSDLSIVKTAIPNPVNAGEDVSYTLTISNNGTSDAQNVSVSDYLPPELTFVSASASSGTWSSPEWTIGLLAANTSQTIEITARVDENVLQSSVISNTAVLSSTTPDPVPGNNTDTYDIDVNALADLSISKVASDNPAVAGLTETYTITVSNAGPSNALDVQVTDVVPSIILNPEYSTDGGSSWNTWSAPYIYGSLSSGGNFNFLLRGTINPTTASGTNLSNTASVSSTTSDPNTANNSDVETVSVGTLSDLSIEKTGPATIVAGTRITYGLTVVNNGPSNAANVVIADAVSGEISNAEYSLNNGNSWGIWNGTRNLPDFEAIPGINNILIRGDLSPDATGTIINTATVSSTTDDPDLSNNLSEVNTIVSGQADLILSKSTLTSPVSKNQPIEYLITVFNNGPSDAPNVLINDLISDAIISNQQYSTNGGGTWNTWTGSFNAGDLLINNSFNLIIKGDVTNLATDPISNTAAVSSDVSDPFPDNNSQTIETPLEVEADLSIVKTGPATIIAGTSIEYTIVATNNSPNMNALSVVISDNVDVDRIADAQFSTNGGSSWSSWAGSVLIGTLNFGATYSIMIKGNVLSNATGVINNIATVNSGTPDPSTGNNSSGITTTITRLADISLEKVLVTDPGSLIAGEPIEYLITYQNDGPSDATNFLITDAVPLSISGVEASRCASAYIAWPGTFNAQTVVAGGTCTIRIRGILSSSFAGSLTNTATVVSDLTDPDLSNNSSTVTNAANSQADLYITKTAVPSPVVAGQNITYTISVSNLGSSDALGVIVTDNLPSELILESAVPSVGTWSSPNWNIGTLTNGSGASLTLVATVKAEIPQGAIISNTATVTGSTPDPVSDNNTATQITSVNASADLSISKTGSNDPVIAGENILYTITVTNNGSSNALNVTVEDIIPAELTLNSATPSSGTWTNPNWNVGTLNVGEALSMEIEANVNSDVDNGSIISNTATVSSTTSDPAQGNNSATKTTLVNAIADLAINKSASSATAIAGEIITYTIDIINNGPSDAVNVEVSDNLPTGLTLVSAVTTIGSWSSPDWNAGNLAVNESASMTIIARVSANVPLGTSISNTATISSSTTDLISANDTSTYISTVFTEANLSIVKTENVDPVVAGENITYTITVTNEGPSDASDVEVSDNLPSSLTLTSAIPENGSWLTPNWNIGTLEAGETTSITIIANVDPTVSQGSNISNTATVSSSTYDPLSSDNSSTATTDVLANADLAVTKSANPNPVIAGEKITYTITISNFGPSDALDVAVADDFPSELDFVSDSTNTGSWSFPNWNIGTIEANTSHTLTIVANVDESVLQSSVISNTVTLSSSTTDPVSGNNTFTHNADVNALADLSITKEALSNPTYAGDSLTYIITVRNDGPSYAQSVQVEDVVPSLLLGAEFSTDGGATWDTWTNLLSHGSLVNGDSFDFLLRGKVNTTSIEGTILTNTASVSSSTSDPNTSNNSDTEIVNVNAQADLSIVKTGPATIIAGTKITYGLTVINQGPSNAANVVIADAVPAGITNAEYSLNNGNSWGIWNGTRNLPDFEAIPGINNILIRGDLAAGATGTIINTATVSSTTADPDLLNNSSVVNTIITGQADLILSKSTLTSPVYKNQPIEYTISVFNAGPSNAPNVVIVDSINPAIISGQQYSTDGGTNWNAWTGSINIGALLHTTTYELLIKGIVTNAAGDPVSNTASVTSDVIDTIPANNTQTIETPLEVEADLSIIKTGPAEITAGTSIQYSIVATNNSPNMNALDVVITDNIDIDLIPDPEFSINGGTTWSPWTGSLHIGPLNFGLSYNLLIRGNVLSNVKVNIPNTAHVSSNTPDPIQANNSSSITSLITRSADISLVKTLVTEPNNLVAGRPIEYLITYHNEGPSDATNFLITDAVPSFITDVEASRCASAYITWPGTFNAQTVVAGGTCTIRIRGLLKSDFIGSITNTATVVSDLSDPNLANNSSTITNTAHAIADLFISKTAVPEPVVAGENLTYTITVTNLGTSDAQVVNVTDILPSELTFESATPSVGTWSSPDWSIGTLTTGSAVTLLLVARVNADTPQGFIISNTATVESTTPDSVSFNNSATQTTSVNTSADLSIIKTGDPDQVVAGENLTYTITVTNNGSSVAVNVNVTDLLPSELTLLSSVPTSGTWTAPVWNIGTLRQGATFSMVVVTKVKSNVETGTIISNTATVSSTTSDPVTGNNSATQTTEVNSVADLVITKTASSASVYAGNNVTYTINVSNNGPSDAVNVVVSDTLASLLQFVSASSNGTYSDQTVTWNISTLESGSNRSFTLVAKTDQNASNGSSITNIAFVKREIGDTIESEPNVITIISNAQLSVTKYAQSNFVHAGDNITYTLSISNSGQTTSENTILADVLPPHVTFVSASGNGTYNNGKVEWLLGDIGTDEIRNVTLIVNVNSDTPNGTIIANKAVAISDNVNDSIDSNIEFVTVVVANTILSVYKTAHSHVVYAGDDITYTISVRNDGSAAATNIEISDELTPMVSFVSASNGGILNGNVVKWNFAALQKNQTVSVTLVVKTAANLLDGTIILNSAVVKCKENVNAIESLEEWVEIESLSNIEITKTADQEAVAAGENLKYTITISNSGPSDAINLVVSDTLTENISFVSASDNGTYNNGIVHWNLPSLHVSETFEFELIVNVKQDVADGTIIRNSVLVTGDSTFVPKESDPEITVVTTVAELEITKIANPKPVVAGGILNYVITVTNNGPSNAANVVVNDLLPPELALISVNHAVGTWISPKWNIGTLLAGSKDIITITAKVNSSLIGGATITNTAIVTSTTADTIQQNNTATDITTIKASADLIIVKSAAPGIVAGSQIYYSITVNNNGPSVAKNVVITDVVPPQISNPTYSTNGGITWKSWDGTLILDSLSAGGTFSISLKGTVAINLTGTISNTAEVIGETPDPNLENNTDTEVTQIISVADLGINKSGPANVVAGEYIVYTFNIAPGPVDATNVEVTDVIPPVIDNAEYSFDGGTNWNIWPSNNKLLIGTVEANVPVSFLVRGKVDAGATGTILNTTTVTGTIPDPDPTNNTDSIRTPIITESDLYIEKIADAATVKAGEDLSYTITVSNSGPSDALNISVSDTLPSGVAFISANNGGQFSGGVVKWNLNSINANTSQNFTVFVKVNSDADDGLKLKNIAVVKTPGNEPPLTSDTSVVIVRSNEILSISKLASKSTVNTGDDITYTIMVENQGNGDAKNLTITDNLPNELTFIGASSGGVELNGLVTWNLASLSAHSIQSLTVTVKVLEPIADGTIIKNIAWLKNRNNENPIISDTSYVVVASNTTLSIEKSASSLTVSAGDDVTYNITIRNNGPNKAFNVEVADTLPLGISFVSASSGGVLTGNVVKWVLSSLNNGESQLYTIIARVASDVVNGVTIRNIATAKANNSEVKGAFSLITVINNPVLSITKAADSNKISIGNPVTYTITVVNNGPGSASNIVVTDDLPAELTFSSADGGGTVLGNKVRWTINSLLEGVSKTLSVTATLNSIVPDGVIIKNYAVLKADNSDTVIVEDPATVIVEVIEPVIVIVANDDSVTVSSLIEGMIVEDILENDSYDGITPTLGEVIITTISPSSNEGVILDTSTGSVTIAKLTPAGNYFITYRICSRDFPSICDEAIITVHVEGSEVIVPNGFSPNGDGVNDLFTIKNIEFYPNAKIEVYNRWGNLLYKKEFYGNTDKWGEYDAWWDGKSTSKWTVGNEKLPIGTYYYILILNESLKPITGSVFINRDN